MRSIRRLGAAAAVFALATAVACGGDGNSEPPDDQPVTYGAGEPETSTTAAPAAEDGAPVTTSSRPAAATTAPTTSEPAEAEATSPSPTKSSPRPSGPEVANRTTRLDASGLELTLVVADKLEFAAAEDITMELSFVNRSGEPRFRNGAQQVFFELIGEDAFWRTTSCQPDFGAQRPPPTAIPIEPDEDNRFVGTYPAAPRSRTRDQCRLPAGEYDVRGIVEWCSPNALSRPGGGGQACDPEADVEVRSDPVRIRIQ